MHSGRSSGPRERSGGKVEFIVWFPSLRWHAQQLQGRYREMGLWDSSKTGLLGAVERQTRRPGSFGEVSAQELNGDESGGNKFWRVLGLEKREGETILTGECIRGACRDDAGQGADTVSGVPGVGPLKGLKVKMTGVV